MSERLELSINSVLTLLRTGYMVGLRDAAEIARTSRKAIRAPHIYFEINSRLWQVESGSYDPFPPKKGEELNAVLPATENGAS